MAVIDANDVDPMPEPEINGEALLDEVRAAHTRYVAFVNDHHPVAATLWTAATHALPAWHHATRMAITSPQKRCAKSRLLDVTAEMSHSPRRCSDATTPAIFRSLMEQGSPETPTLFVDEADALFGTKKAAEQNEDLRSLFNSGWQLDRPVLRCVGASHATAEFNTFAMAALAAIKGLPDTITDRSVHIVLQRRRPTDQVRPFRVRRDRPALNGLRDQLSRWVRNETNLAALGRAEPEMPVEDRYADAWEPLIAIADLAGGHWPETAREACLEMCSEAEEEEGDLLGILLLTDVKKIFDAVKLPFLGSQDLVDRLRQVKDSPWDDFEMTPSKLAYRLKPYGVRSDRNTTGDQRGYKLEQFHDLFGRYARQKASKPSDAGR